MIYENKNCKVYCGDARDFIDEISADCFVSDPPYGINGGSGTISKQRAKGNYDADFPDTPEYIKTVCAPIIERCLERFGRGALTPGGKCAFSYPQPLSLGGYVQNASSGLCHWGACTLQPILFYGRDPMIGKTITPITYQLNEAPEKNGHPCPKPLKAWTWLVMKVSAEGETVFDPFTGSGTTAIACLRSGRKFIGVELEKKYFDLTCKRIDDFYRQVDLFR